MSDASRPARRRLTDLSVGQRLFGGFGLVIAMSLLLAALGVTGSQSQSAGALAIAQQARLLEGATNAQFDPMNAPSPITVRYLKKPS